MSLKTAFLAAGDANRTANDAGAAYLLAYAEMCKAVHASPLSIRGVIAEAKLALAERPGHKVLGLYPTNNREVFKIRTLGAILNLAGGEDFKLGTFRLTDSVARTHDEHVITLDMVGKWITQPGLTETAVNAIVAGSSAAEECVTLIRRAAGNAKLAKSESSKGEAKGGSKGKGKDSLPEDKTAPTMADKVQLMALLAADITGDTTQWSDADAVKIDMVIQALTLAGVQWQTARQAAPAETETVAAVAA